MLRKILNNIYSKYILFSFLPDCNCICPCAIKMKYKINISTRCNILSPEGLKLNKLPHRQILEKNNNLTSSALSKSDLNCRFQPAFAANNIFFLI